MVHAIFCTRTRHNMLAAKSRFRLMRALLEQLDRSR